jgi:AcrR family transcriptional regulator
MVHVVSVVGLRERKKLELRERLCDEARRLFAAQDSAAVSVDVIAQAAGVSRATFFNYFPSKGALLDELAGHMTDRLRRYLEEERALGQPLEATLVHWFARSVATIRRSESLTRLLFGRAFAGAEENELRATQMAAVHRAYEGLVADAQARGEVDARADVAFHAEMLAGSMTMLLNNWFNDPAYPLEARAEQTARFVAAAMMADRVPRAKPARAPRKKETHARIRTR